MDLPIHTLIGKQEMSTDGCKATVHKKNKCAGEEHCTAGGKAFNATISPSLRAAFRHRSGNTGDLGLTSLLWTTDIPHDERY